MNTSSTSTAILRQLSTTPDNLDTDAGSKAKQVLVNTLTELGNSPETILERLEQLGQRGQTVLLG